MPVTRAATCLHHPAMLVARAPRRRRRGCFDAAPETFAHLYGGWSRRALRRAQTPGTVVCDAGRRTVAEEPHDAEEELASFALCCATCHRLLCIPSSSLILELVLESVTWAASPSETEFSLCRATALHRKTNCCLVLSPLAFSVNLAGACACCLDIMSALQHSLCSRVACLQTTARHAPFLLAA